MPLAPSDLNLALISAKESIQRAPILYKKSFLSDYNLVESVQKVNLGRIKLVA